jgi:hypothetical protein
MRKKEEGGERRGRRSDGPIFYTTTTGTSYYLYRHTGTLVTVVLYCNTRYWYLIKYYYYGYTQLPY